MKLSRSAQYQVKFRVSDWICHVFFWQNLSLLVLSFLKKQFWDFYVHDFFFCLYSIIKNLSGIWSLLSKFTIQFSKNLKKRFSHFTCVIIYRFKIKKLKKIAQKESAFLENLSGLSLQIETTYFGNSVIVT